MGRIHIVQSGTNNKGALRGGLWGAIMFVMAVIGPCVKIGARDFELVGFDEGGCGFRSQAVHQFCHA